MGPVSPKVIIRSTETYFILKNILLAGGEIRKKYKNDIFLENNNTWSLKSLFPYIFRPFNAFTKL